MGWHELSWGEISLWYSGTSESVRNILITGAMSDNISLFG